MNRHLQYILFAASLIQFASGCLFAPSKYGDSGVALPGLTQYERYLRNCRERYPILEECCQKWGEPSAIQIGSSGGYFVWKDNPEWVKAKTFGASLIYGHHPKLLRSFVFENQNEEWNKLKRSVAKPLASYTIERFERMENDEFSYLFRLRLKAEAGFSEMDMIKRELRSTIGADYVGAHGGKASEVHVDLPVFALKDSVIEGRAAVMRITVESLCYDSQTQKGVIAVKIGSSRFEDARQWVRKNVESLARDKNVALMTGKIPSAARFYLGAERIKPGNILEIEFETE